MSFQFQGPGYTQGTGTTRIFAAPHLDVRAPNTTDILYPLGQVWIDMSALPREPTQSISLPVERGESTYKAQGKITFNAYIEVSLLHLFIKCLASI